MSTEPGNLQRLCGTPGARSGQARPQSKDSCPRVRRCVRGKGVALSSAAAGLWQIRGAVAVGMGNTFGPGETGRRCFHLAGRSNSWHHRRPQKGFGAPVMRVTTISQEETDCGQADCSIMPSTCKLHGPASHCALAFLSDNGDPIYGIIY